MKQISKLKHGGKKDQRLTVASSSTKMLLGVSSARAKETS
jgi:hypothetical protein